MASVDCHHVRLCRGVGASQACPHASPSPASSLKLAPWKSFLWGRSTLSRRANADETRVTPRPGPVFRAAAKQAVKEKPPGKARKEASPKTEEASPLAAAAATPWKSEPLPALPPATGLLDGKDPAWKIGTESKARLKAYYEAAVVPALTAEFGYTNPQEVPGVQKVVVNCGIGDASQSSKVLEAASKDLALVTGQRPVVTRSRKAIAGFKLRQGVPVGMAATLRGQVMYSYLDRLFNLALPRVRDFRGVSKGGFDGKGNYSMGLSEQTMYPEIQFDQIDKSRGMDISIVTTAETDREAQRLLELLGMPFKEGPAPVKDPRAKAKGRGGKGGGRSGRGAKQQTKAKKKK